MTQKIRQTLFHLEMNLCDDHPSNSVFHIILRLFKKGIMNTNRLLANAFWTCRYFAFHKSKAGFLFISIIPWTLGVVHEPQCDISITKQFT